ncbi:transposase DNA-binding-containing protein [Polaromonas sp.]|uniref:IS4/Tn5 family transposase DNA-binding protein n=1 Tax=Polaromonas sp. TaxID=1869339 RepID=UPI0017B4B677|nr:transposase DNA-binding-containing protein [Polaromonas sp.]NMM05902.1 hypothetical protein [Polaromonas sp.]
MSWAATEFESIDLGDPRRNRRTIGWIERLSAELTASIVQACGMFAHPTYAVSTSREPAPWCWIGWWLGASPG